MKISLVCILILLAPWCWAIPNAVGAFANRASALNGQDLTEVFLSKDLWKGSKKLPGEWVPDAGVADASCAYLVAQPEVLGLKALFVRALHRGQQLEELQLTFVDAGSFFGYLEQAPVSTEGLSKKEARAELQKRFEARKAEFSEIYGEQKKSLFNKLFHIAKRPRQVKRGRTRTLRADFTEYRYGNLILRVLDAPDRLLRLTIRRQASPPKSWLDRAQENFSARDRLTVLQKNVTDTESGDVLLKGVEIVPQGYRPYCGLNTLTMVSRYLGLHLDEDWLAVAGKFQNTGSAAGSDMLGLYRAVAKEAGFNMKRLSKYDHAAVQSSLRNGMPVIVWRRWSRERDKVHTLISKRYAAGKNESFPELDEARLPSKEKSSPLHASVIVGFNDERQEILFLESWAGRATPRRMPIKEIEHTADFTFCFQP